MTTDALCESYTSTGALLLKAAFFGLTDWGVLRLGFLPDVACSHDGVYLRSTNVPRTIESLQQVIHGLYPDSRRTPEFVPQLRIRCVHSEQMKAHSGV